MPSERDEAADDPVIDPVLGDPRMVAAPRITTDRAATILGTNREHVYWIVDQGRLPAYGSPHQNAGCCCPMYGVSRAGESRSVCGRPPICWVAPSVTSGTSSPPASSPRFPTRRRAYRQEVQALAQVRQVKPAARPRRPVAGGQVPPDLGNLWDAIVNQADDLTAAGWSAHTPCTSRRLSIPHEGEGSCV
jgi:hypothetical protein